MIHKFEQGGLYIVIDVNSGAVHVVDELVYDLLDHYPQIDADAAAEMLLGKYEAAAIKAAAEEIDALIEAEQLYCEDQYIHNIEFKERKPVIKALCLHVAHDCNLRCKYCFASQGDYESHRSLMALETGKKAFDFLVEHSGNRRNLEVDFFGGEPLMNFEVCKDLVTYGRELEKKHNKNFRFTMTTNGVLLDEEKMAYLNEEMHNVVLSVDGRPAVNDFMRPAINGAGSYDVIMPKFKKMVEMRGDKMYYIRGTFTRFNTDFAKDILHMADQGFEQVSIEPVVAEPKHDYALRDEDLNTIFKQYDELAEEILERKGTDKSFNFFHFMIDLSQGPCIVKRLSGCGAGAEYIAVTPEGDIYPCHQFVGNEDFKMGSVLTGEMDRSLNVDFKNAHVYNKPDCKECWAKFYCSGGCHANAYNFNDDINKPYRLGCEMERKRLECSLYIQAKLMTEE